MKDYREYCVVAIDRSKYGNKYKELFRGKRKDCRDFIKNYCNYNGGYYFRVGVCSWDVEVKQVKGDNSIYNTANDSHTPSWVKEDLERAINEMKRIYEMDITRRDMEQKVKKYITSDTHRLEDYSDIEICCDTDRDDALRIMDFRIANSSIEQLENFHNAIDTDTVDYFKHGCR